MIELDKEAMPQKTNGDRLSGASIDEKALMLEELLNQFYLCEIPISFKMFARQWLNSPVEVKDE